MLEKTIKIVERRPEHLLGLKDQIKDYIFSNRNITDVKQLDYSLRNLINPFLFKDINKAVKRLIAALIENENIVIIGDYDADGATSTSLVYMSLKKLGFTNVNYIIPDRIIHGYGLSPALVELAVTEYQANLIITVDNGISSFDGVDYANYKKVDVIITDHHLGGDETPPAVAIINPNQKGCNFPSKSLTGVGVAYYLMKVINYYIHEQFSAIAKAVNLANTIIYDKINTALEKKDLAGEKFNSSEIETLRRKINKFLENYDPNFNPDQFLDLVAVGTVADLANLDYNNRILVEQGVRRIRASQCSKGIQAILKVQKINNIDFSADDISFKVAPLINAIGRMDNMVKGVECLIANDERVAEVIACEMAETNKKRSVVQAENSQQALEQFETRFKHTDCYSICLYDPSWHQGVIGLNSSIIKDKYWRPTFVFSTDEGGLIKGSGRSINSLHIKDCLDTISQRYPGLIIKFGGHSGAAGVTIREKDFIKFSEAFETIVRETADPDDIGQETIFCDLELPVNYITLDFAKELVRLGPWGKGFPEPVFKSRFKIYNSPRLVGRSKRDTLIFDFMDANNICHSGVKFKATPEFINSLAPEMDVFYTMSINRYCGRESLSLIIKHMIPVE
ncbi:single-stranded-DNA-specific exonuclease RecJ [Psittacicella gerlachiana]|uniref:Single-stranded-DNA-specific exonuclease RecJ n=1 Tax=Psittacicella gerlachiana TaxID=2028574 RepID=A0A3A1YBA6_9GAMM|nr:single-stranded-DNA-specific exonuclease RecJ [Psittacicella gerlachiana]RIY33397.1 single-stranded-DNA-specific exonuclease RecJ [Psittacicella gerlachiana]